MQLNQPTGSSGKDQSELISFSPPSTSKPSFNLLTNASSFSDLEGLDFTLPATAAVPNETTTVITEASQIYPDISAAFRLVV